MADRRLQVFHAVATQRSFTKAAETLFMTQPAVTFQIKQLEERYNMRLLERGAGRISLTPAGELVLDYAERILGLSGELETRLTEMGEQMSGPLLIGASATIAEFMLPPILSAFNLLYPQVRTRLTVANSGTVENRVIGHVLDIGLIEAPSKLSALQAEVCCNDELQVICAPSHPLAKFSEIDPTQLLEYEFISREPGSRTREVTDAYLRAGGIAPEEMNILMELDSPEALKSVVGTGLGCAIVSRASIAKEIELGSLLARPLQPRLVRTLSLVYPKEKFRSRIVNAFVEFTKKNLREFSV